jgi:hypothetical protein
MGRNRAIAEDRAGNLWVARASDKAEVGVLGRDGKFRTFDRGDGLPALGIQNIFEDGKANLWLSTYRELCKWSPGHVAECRSFPRAGLLSIGGGGAADLLAGDDPEPLIRVISNPSLTPPKCAMRHTGPRFGTLGIRRDGSLHAIERSFERFRESTAGGSRA